MALTQLDPKTALVVIDLQNGIVKFPVAHAIEGVIANNELLLRAFRKHQLPIVLVNVAGGAPGRAEQSKAMGDLPPGWADLIPQLQAGADEHRVTKRTWGAFTGTDLEAHLRGLGVTQIVLSGVASSIGVESTARFAHELGFNLTLAVDAMTDMNLDAHNNSVQRIFPRLGETGTAQEVVQLLEQSRS